MRGLTGAPPLDFDYYALAFAWQPEWAATACPGGRNVNPVLVNAMNRNEHAQRNLSLHGLWPDYGPARRAAGIGWPQFCNTCSSSTCTICERTESCNFASCAANVTKAKCGIPASVVSEFNTTSKWQRYAPSYAWGTLARHEWAKHGTCSNWYMDARRYFAAAEAAAQRFLAGRGAALVRQSVGTTVSSEALRAAFAADVRAAPALVCTSACALSEVWIGLPKNASDEWSTVSNLPWHRVGVDMSEADRCSDCSHIAIKAWAACGDLPTPVVSPVHNMPLILIGILAVVASWALVLWTAMTSRRT